MPTSPEDSDVAFAGDNVEKSFHSQVSDEKTHEDSILTNSRHTVDENQKKTSRRKGDVKSSHNNKENVQKVEGLLDNPEKSRVSVGKNVSTDRVATGKNERNYRKNERHYRSNRDNDVASGDELYKQFDDKRTQELIKGYRVSERPRVKSEINKEQLHNRDEHLNRKRKTDERVGSYLENESQKRNARDAIRTSKVGDRAKDVSEKESKYNGHNEEVKTRVRSIVEKYDSVHKNESHKRNARDLIQTSKVSDRGKDMSERESRRDRHNEEGNIRGRSIVEKHEPNTENEFQKRNAGDVIETSKVSDRGKDLSEKESRHIRHNKEDKTRGRGIIEKDDSVPENESQKRNASDGIERSKVSGIDKYISEKESRRNRHHEEDKMRGRSMVGKHHLVTEDESQKRNARDAVDESKVSDRGKDIFEKESRQSRHNEEDKTRGRGIVENHDSEKVLKQVSHEDPRSKRRRSRSPEYERDKERGRRYSLHSPEVHKHTSKDKKEYEDVMLHSIKDRAGREHSYADKKRISGNESHPHYWRNTGSSSGLGGYSPRKRKSDTAARTPSPTRRSPERRNAGWDLLPVVNKNINAGSSSTRSNLHSSSQNMSSNGYPSGTMITPTVMNPVGISHTTLSSRIQAIESIQLTQATRPMRRLYVENLPDSAAEKDLIGCINKLLLPSGVNYVQGAQPCISCIIHKEKGQALLEFLTPEDASIALSFDGIYFSGSNLKIRRPKDYTDVTTGLLEKSVVAFDSISGIVEDSPNKIFIGGISKLLSSKMLLEIVEVFGPVKAYHYQRIANSSEQCAFLEYVDHSATSKACAGLNGMRLGGQVLTAVLATPDALLENLDREPFYGIPNHAKPLLEKPTTVVMLKNVIDPEGVFLLSESEVEEVLEDIRLECSRFGTVKSVNVSKPTNSIDTTVGNALNSNLSTDGCNIELEKKSYISEQLGESVDVKGDHDRSESSEKLNESEHKSQIEEDDEGCDNTEIIPKPLAESVEREDNLTKGSTDDTDGSNTHLGQENIGMELEIQEIISINAVESNDETSESIPTLMENNIATFEFEIENKPIIEQELKVEIEESNIEKTNDVNGDVAKELGYPVECNKKDAFEPGSVFVEFRRAEAACIAAHCLHGRIFDGRVVTVGYVSHDIYQVAFRK